LSRRADSAAVRPRALVLVALALGVGLGAADQTATVTVLPSIVSDVGITASDFYRSSWIVNGYLLGYLVALPLLGRVADVYGRGRVFAGTLVLFAAGSMLVALAPTFEMLVAARAVQAVGGGGLIPVAMAIVVDELPPARRAFGLGGIAAAAEAGALFGPLWGGVIAESVGWRWVFWANLPLVVPLVPAVWRTVVSRPQPARIDWLGGALLAAALAVLTVALVDDPIAPRPLMTTAALLAASGALAVAFLRHEARADASMVRLAMFRPRPLWAACLVNALVGGGLMAALIGVPLFVNIVLGASPLTGGLTLMRLTVMVPVGAFAGGWLAGRIELRAVAAAGLLLTTAGFAGLAQWDRALAEPLRSFPLLTAGLGFGLVVAPLGAAVLQHVDAAERATASAWLTVARVIGMLVGAALLASQGLGRFYARAASISFASPDFEALVREAELATFREVFIGAAVVMLLASLAALLIGRGRAEPAERSWASM
jgi:MFS family permease